MQVLGQRLRERSNFAFGFLMQFMWLDAAGRWKGVPLEELSAQQVAECRITKPVYVPASVDPPRSDPRLSLVCKFGHLLICWTMNFLHCNNVLALIFPRIPTLTLFSIELHKK